MLSNCLLFLEFIFTNTSFIFEPQEGFLEARKMYRQNVSLLTYECYTIIFNLFLIILKK